MQQKDVDKDKVHLCHYRVIRLPGIWGMSFHNCAHGHTQRCPPCISARAFAGSPSPLVPQMILLLHNWHQMNNQVLDVQEKLAMVAFAYRLMPSSAQWTCIAQFPPSSQVQCELCRSGTCHNQWNTWSGEWKQYRSNQFLAHLEISPSIEVIVGNSWGNCGTDTLFIEHIYTKRFRWMTITLQSTFHINTHRYRWMESNSYLKGCNISVPEFGSVLSRDIKHSLSQHTTFPPRVHVPIERSSPWPVTFMVATVRIDHQLAHKTNYKTRISSNIMSEYIMMKPCNHVWHGWCNWLNLCSKLVPLWNVSICITYISNVENYINVL